jgi:hypothetical protein
MKTAKGIECEIAVLPHPTGDMGQALASSVRRLDSPKSQVSPSRWPGQAHTARHRSALGERHRHLGAGLNLWFFQLRGNLSNTLEG